MGDVGKTRKTDWRVTWGNYDLGFLDAIDPKLKYMLDAIRVGTMGKAKLGDRFSGLDGNVEIEVREIHQGQFASLTAHHAGSGSIDLTPPINKDLYDYAKELRLHPEDLPTLTKTEDLVLVKATPTTPLNLKRDGTKDDVWKVSFEIYPDRARFPKLCYGYIGVAPPSSWT